MVKHPQSQLGYAVNGVTVFMPARKIERATTFSATTKPLQKKQKRQKTKRAVRYTNKSTLQYQVAHGLLRSKMEDIKIACKRGDVDGAVSAAVQASLTWAGPRRGRVLLLWIQYLFIKDMEGRSGIYYAAHTGNTSMVQLFLALLVLERATHRGWAIQNLVPFDERLTDSKTMLQWLEHVGFPSVQLFSRSDFDLCILNALNDLTKEVFHKQKYSWQLLLFIVRSDANVRRLLDRPSTICMSEKQNVSGVSVINNAKTKQRPKLCVDDDFDPNIERTYFGYEDEEEYEVGEEEANGEGLQWSDLETTHDSEFDWLDCDLMVAENADALSEICEDSIAFDSVGFHDNEQHCPSFDIEDTTQDHYEQDDTSIQSDSQWSHLNGKWDEMSVGLLERSAATGGFHAVQNEPDAFSWKDELEGDASLLSVVQTKDELRCVSTTDWDVVSDCQSVISLDSFQPVRKSYLDIVSEHQLSEAVVTRPPTKCRTQTSSVEQHRRRLPVVSESSRMTDDSMMFDAYFDVESVKEARGGKKKLMFKGGRGRRQTSVKEVLDNSQK